MLGVVIVVTIVLQLTALKPKTINMTE